MNRFSDLKPSRWRGLCIPDFVNGVWVIPIFHPSFAYRNEDDPLILSQYERDLDFAIECVRTKGKLRKFCSPRFKFRSDFKKFWWGLWFVGGFNRKTHWNPLFRLWNNGSQALQRRSQNRYSIFDYWRRWFSYSFPVRYPHWTELQTRQIENKWKKVLRTQSKKVAHNIKFEDVWSRVILNTTPRNWHWDTMLTVIISWLRQSS